MSSTCPSCGHVSGFGALAGLAATPLRTVPVFDRTGRHIVGHALQDDWGPVPGHDPNTVAAVLAEMEQALAITRGKGDLAMFYVENWRDRLREATKAGG